MQQKRRYSIHTIHRKKSARAVMLGSQVGEGRRMTLEEMREIREARGYSYRMLSEYSGVPVVTIQKIFSGETKNPRRSTLDALEKVLGGEEDAYQGKTYQYLMGSLEHLDLVCEPEYVYDSSAEEENGFVEKPQGTYTVEDYYKIPDERRVELIDGVIYDMSAPTTVHQDIVFYIHMCIYNHIREKKKPCKVYESPVDVQLDRDNRTMLQPDVMLICEREKVELKKIYGAPDFVLEVLSPSTRKRDLTLKVQKYLYAGVREYWVIDPNKKYLMKYNFMDENFFPELHSLEETVELSVSNGELFIDLTPVKESIEEFEPAE